MWNNKSTHSWLGSLSSIFFRANPANDLMLHKVENYVDRHLNSIMAGVSVSGVLRSKIFKRFGYILGRTLCGLTFVSNLTRESRIDIHLRKSHDRPGGFLIWLRCGLTYQLNYGSGLFFLRFCRPKPLNGLANNGAR